MAALFLTGIVLYAIGSLMQRRERHPPPEHPWLPEYGPVPADILAYRRSRITLRGCLWSAVIAPFALMFLWWAFTEVAR